MTASRWICVVQAPNPNDIRSESDFHNKTTDDITSLLGDKYCNGHLCLHTPLFRLRLPPTCVILTEYPFLLQPSRPDRYPPPSHHLSYRPNDDLSDITFFIPIETQLSVTFPPLAVSFTHHELQTFAIGDVLSRCCSAFTYDCLTMSLQQNSDELDPMTPASTIFSPPSPPNVIFVCEVTDKDEKKIRHRIAHCEDMVATERTFIAALCEIRDYWEPSFRKAKLFSEDEHRAMFNNLLPILSAHCTFLAALECAPVSFATEFGPPFLNFVEYFKIGASFVSKFKKMDGVIKEHLGNSFWARKWAEIERNLPSGSGRDFLSYYVTPVQRYPRYPLLLRDLHKATPEFHPDRIYLARAIARNDDVNKEINESAAKENQIEDMAAIQQSFGASIRILEPGRKLLKLANVRIAGLRTLSGVLLLFNDVVVVGSTARRPWQLILATAIKDFRFASGRPAPMSLYFVAEERENVVQFVDAAERAEWMAAFAELRAAALQALRARPDGGIWKWLDCEIDAAPALMLHDGCFLRDAAWFFGGTNASRAETDALVEYQLASKAVRTTQGAPSPRHSHTVTACNGMLYVCFGCCRKECYNDVWQYDPAADAWTQFSARLPPLPKRFGHSAVSGDIYLYIFGGQDDQGRLLNDFLIIDTLTFTVDIRVLQFAPSPRMYHTSVYLPQQFEVVIFGGRTARAIANDIHVLPIGKMEWVQPSIARVAPRMYHKSFLVGNWMVAIGGTSGTENVGITAFDTNDWTEIPIHEHGNKPFGLIGHAAVPVAPTRLLIFGGTDSLTRVGFATAYILDVADGLIEKAAEPRAMELRARTGEPRRENAAKAAPRPATMVMRGAAVGLLPPEEQLLVDMKLDLSKLAEFEKTVTRRKIKKIVQLAQENREMADKVARLEELTAGTFRLPAHTRLLLKVFDNATKATTIMRATSDDDAAQLKEMIENRIGRAAMLSIQVGISKKAMLSQEALLQAHESVVKNLLRGLVVVAL